MPIQVGLIGLGEVAQLMHLPLLADDPRFAIAAVADASPGLTARDRRRYGARPLADAPARSPIPTSTPSSSSRPTTCTRRSSPRAIAAGKHVFVEKPVGLTAAELEPLIAANRGNPKVVFVGYMRRFSRPFLELEAPPPRARRHPPRQGPRHHPRGAVLPGPDPPGPARRPTSRPSSSPKAADAPPSWSAASPAPTLPTTSGAPTSS